MVGATGTGKSYLAGALAEHACRKGHRALLLRMPRLFEELAIARAPGNYAATLARYEKFDLLILDDFLMAPLADPERRDLLELLEDQHERSSTIFTSQTPPKTWHAAIGDSTIADAICDRIVHNSKVITLRGPSLRKSMKSSFLTTIVATLRSRSGVRTGRSGGPEYADRTEGRAGLPFVVGRVRGKTHIQWLD